MVAQIAGATETSANKPIIAAFSARVDSSSSCNCEARQCRSNVLGAMRLPHPDLLGRSNLVRKTDLPPFLRLPSQEGIGLPTNDIPDIGRVARAGTGDCDYIPVYR